MISSGGIGAFMHGLGFARESTKNRIKSNLKTTNMEHPEKRIAEIANRMAILAVELKKLNEDLFLSGHNPTILEDGLHKNKHLQFMRYSLNQLTTEVDRLKQVF